MFGRRRTLIGASLFVSGFVVIFTTLGASASVLGSFLQGHREAFVRLQEMSSEGHIVDHFYNGFSAAIDIRPPL